MANEFAPTWSGLHTFSAGVRNALAPSVGNDLGNKTYIDAADALKADAAKVYGASQSLSGAGAVDVTSRTTFLTATGIGDALTLANGTFTGQRKSVTGSSGYGTNTSILTPTTFGDGTTMTFSANFDSVELEWNGSTWKLVNKTGAVVIA